MPYVIVVIGGECEHYRGHWPRRLRWLRRRDGHDCVLWVRGPYKNRDEGRAAFDECVRLGEMAHWMSMDPTPAEPPSG